ncbi:hypothetical protein QBC37DRAFT_64037 [Rhypophila decipiens]|uniref:Uncharacterized protein n=1 Tax=Rhypophila decipiens TaxID=261697 RepID=A0AAN6XYB4_9PEZI|nr:hypothetical protein QBC37DRAFT_64037 [Rhypophila decipiens]
MRHGHTRVSYICLQSFSRFLNKAHAAAVSAANSFISSVSLSLTSRALFKAWFAFSADFSASLAVCSAASALISATSALVSAATTLRLASASKACTFSSIAVLSCSSHFLGILSARSVASFSTCAVVSPTEATGAAGLGARAVARASTCSLVSPTHATGAAGAVWAVWAAGCPPSSTVSVAPTGAGQKNLQRFRLRHSLTPSRFQNKGINPQFFSFSTRPKSVLSMFWREGEETEKIDKIDRQKRWVEKV